MSWETFVVGHFRFKSGVPEKLKMEIIEELEDVLETKLKWDERWGDWKVEDVNWSSHVDDESIDKVYRKWKNFFKEFSVSLYYLSEPNYTVHEVKDDQDEVIGLLDSILEALFKDLEECKEVSEEMYGLAEFLRLLDFKESGMNAAIIAKKIEKFIENVEKVRKTENLVDFVKLDVLEELINVLEIRNIPVLKLRKLLLMHAL